MWQWILIGVACVAWLVLTIVPWGDGDYILGPECGPGCPLYYCPTSGEVECPLHGGFDVCCDRPDLHDYEEVARHGGW